MRNIQVPNDLIKNTITTVTSLEFTNYKPQRKCFCNHRETENQLVPNIGTDNHFVDLMHTHTVLLVTLWLCKQWLHTCHWRWRDAAVVHLGQQHLCNVCTNQTDEAQKHMLCYV